MVTIDELTSKVLGESILLINSVELTFEVLSLVKGVYEYIDWENLKIESIDQGGMLENSKFL